MALKTISFGSDVFIPTNVLKSLIASNLYFNLALGFSTFATKTLEPGKAPVEVMAYKEGDYFGERALLKNEPRAANVIAKTDCCLVSMDRHSVKRLLGPLEALLRRNFDLYEKYTAT